MSLADVYDVKGSIAGVEQLRPEEVQLVHEMGHTIFSERISAGIRRISTGAIAQNTTWDLVISNLPTGITRILGVQVINNAGGRTRHATVLIGDGTREIPIYTWDSTNGVEAAGRIVDEGAAAADVNILTPTFGGLPSLMVGTGQPQAMEQIAFRGLTTGFGAGTVTNTMLLYQAFTEVGGGNLSNLGLPIPGW